MAIRTFRAAAALLAVLSLGSCQVLEFVFSSVFPSTVSLAKAQADLSSQISADSASSYNVRVVESGGYGYVVVIGPQPGSTSSIAYFYDLDLNQKPTRMNLPASSGIMVDANGFLVVGSTQLNAADLSVVTTFAAAQVTLTGSTVGVDGFIGSGNNLLGLYTSGATLYWGGYSPTWSNGLAMGSFPVISTTMPNLALEATLDDGVSGGNVYLVVSPTSGGSNNTVTGYFITAQKNNFVTTALTGLADTAPHQGGLLPNSFGFAQGSIFAYENSSSSFVRIDPATGATVSSLYVGVDYTSTRFAYRSSGGSFYGFDTKTRVLTKYTAWW